MSWLESIINFLYLAANVLPLPIFSFFGSLIEEIIPPIPSPLVMALAGALAMAKGSAWIYMGAIIVIGAVGKTMGSLIVYLIADKGEDIVLGRFGKFFGITHKEVEVIGKNLNKGWKDDVILFFLRAVPIMPTSPVSIVCGLIKVNLRTYVISTFLGVLVRNIFYFYLGYMSMGAIESINEKVGGLEKIGYIILLVIIAAILTSIYRNKKKGYGHDFKIRW